MSEKAVKALLVLMREVLALGADKAERVIAAVLREM